MRRIKRIKEIQKYYYEKDYCPSPDFYLIERDRIVCNYLDNLGSNNYLKILDVGGNKGQLLSKLPTKHFRVCLDNSLAAMQKKINSVNLHFCLGDASKLPFQDSSMDMIICSEVLEHLINPNLALNEFYRVLKSEGILIVTVPNLVELWGWFLQIKNIKKLVLMMFNKHLREKAKVYFDDRTVGGTSKFSVFHGHIHVKSPIQWKKILKKSGFDVLETSGILILPLREKLYLHLNEKSLQRQLKIEDKVRKKTPFKCLSNGVMFISKKTEVKPS